MSTEQFKWVELCVGSQKYRGDLAAAKDTWAHSLRAGWDKPAFFSAYFLPDAAKDLMEATLKRDMATYEAAVQRAQEAGMDPWQIKKPRGSLRGFRGEHWAPFFVLDIDTRRESPKMKRIVNKSGTKWIDRTAQEEADFLKAHPDWKPDTEAPKRELFEVLRVLESHGVDPELLLICFSGNKGFHVYVPTAYFDPEPCETFAYRLRWMVETKITPELDTKAVPFPKESMDWQVFTPVTVMRAINSKHEKSGLYKVPLTYGEVQTTRFEDIRKSATAPRSFKNQDWRKVQKSSTLRQLWEESKDKCMHRAGSDAESGRVFEIEGRLHFEADKVLSLKQPPRSPLCVLKMLREDVGKGNRNQAMLILISTLRNQGHTAATAFAVMKEWRKLQVGTHHTEDDVAAQIQYVYGEAFNWNCNHPLVMANCFKACHLYRSAETTRSVELHRLPDLLSDLVARERVPINYFFPYVPFNEDIRLRPGMVVTLVAETGSGKTALALDICRYNSYNLDQNAVDGYVPSGGIGFASLEMPRAELVERGAQWVLSEDQKGVANVINRQIEAEDESRADVAEYRALREALKKYYNRVFVIDDDYVDLDRLETLIVAGKEKHDIGLWAVDYMGRLHGKGHSSYDKLSSIARELKTIARRNQVIIMILVQVARDASEKGLGLRSGRGSGEIEESADVLITLEIEDRDKPESQRSGNIILTNRKFRAGRKGSTCKLRFVGEHMRFFPADDKSNADTSGLRTDGF